MNNEWKSINQQKPKIKEPIEFKTKNGEKYSGTFLNENEFKSIEGKVFEIEEVEKWKIRGSETDTNWIDKKNLRYKGRIISVIEKFDSGHYWKVSSSQDGNKILSKEKTQTEAIQKLKYRIDQNNK